MYSCQVMIDLLAAAPRRNRIDVRIVVRNAIVERIHPCADDRGAQQGRQFVQDGVVKLHSKWTVDSEIRMTKSEIRMTKGIYFSDSESATDLSSFVIRSSSFPRLLPFAAEHFHGRARHVDVTVFGPV